MEKPRNSIRVLIVDDESIVAQRLLQYLRGKGFDVRYSASVEEVKKLTTSWRPHLVLYDLVMPQMTGLTSLRFIGADRLPPTERPKVIIVPGHNDQANVRECLKTGAADYIAKPCTPAEILSRIILSLKPKREVG